MIVEAKHKLTRLGLMVFYLYILLAVMGAAGLVFGILGMILKFMQQGPVVNTPWHEVITLTIVSALILKLFWRESVNLLREDEIKPPEKNEDEIITPPSLNTAVVIPFKKIGQANGNHGFGLETNSQKEP